MYKRVILINIIVFAFFTILRELPQFSTGIYPTGFDTTDGYIIEILSPLAVKLSMLFTEPLLPDSLWLIHSWIHIDPFYELKILSPFLYGTFIWSFFFMLNRGFSWSEKKALFTTLVFGIEPVVLRMGWDLLAQEIGLSELFVLIGATSGKIIFARKDKTVLLLSLAIVLSSQTVSLLLFTVISWQILQAVRHKTLNVKSLLPVCPMSALFIGMIFFSLIPNFANALPTILLKPEGEGPNIVYANPMIGDSAAPIVNYFTTDPRFISNSYASVIVSIVSLSLYAIIPLIPLAWYGFHKDVVLFPQTLILVLLGYSILVWPYYSFADYWRWIMLLSIPLTIYAAAGLQRILSGRNGAIRWATIGLILLISLTLSVSYSAAALPMSRQVQSYLPSSLTYTSFPLSQVSSLDDIANYINSNSGRTSLIVVNDTYAGFLKAHLKENLTLYVIPLGASLGEGLQLIKSSNITSAYIISTDLGNPIEYNMTLVTSSENLGLYDYSSA